MLKIGFIGAGIVGTALATLLSRNGYEVTCVSSRSRKSAKNLAKAVEGCNIMDTNQDVADAADFVFITTPDDVIPRVVSRVKWRKRQSVVHCSGADSVEILEPARKSGARVGGFHPLQTFAGIDQAIENIPGSTFVIESDEPLLTTLQDMATALGGKWIQLKSKDKVAYHAAAVFACNYLVTLVKLSTDLWETFRIPPDKATAALLPLLRGTLNNIERLGIPRCLTGPIARGDTGTVSKHLDMLKKKAPALMAPYTEMGRQTIPIALAKGKIDKKRSLELDKILKAS
ncbi:MAG TPA: DUF2520 domain-containing protein [Dehalococcoidia bacterium]|nr:DUF2520 domain-containing protein [Dehalococcoidia bacterium]